MGVVVRHPPITANMNTATTTVSNNAGNRKRNIDSKDYCDHSSSHRIAIQTPPLHPGLMGLIFPWRNGISLKIGMLGWKNFACFIGISRDRSQARNRITIDTHGQPLLHYSITDADHALLLAGQEMNLRCMRAAGAVFLFIAHENFPWYYCGNKAAIVNDSDRNMKKNEDEDNESERFEEYLRAVRAEGVQTGKMQVISAHQMSTCRMAYTPETGPTSPSGELYQCANLFIADASVFPTSLGINPMVTIEAISHMIAGNICILPLYVAIADVHITFVIMYYCI